MFLIPKLEPYRSKRYRDYVRQLPSVISEQPGDDPHHIKRPGFGGTIKCSDLTVIPLTRIEHDAFHRMGWKEWEDVHGCQLDHVVATIERAFQDGFFVEVA